MATQKRTIKTERAALRDYTARIAYWQGEAQWTNGYRAGAKTEGREDDRLYAKEQDRYKRVDAERKRFELALARYTRLVRAAAKA